MNNLPLHKYQNEGKRNHFFRGIKFIIMSVRGGIDTAKNNLTTASNNYAEIQKQLDRYNKVFDTYSKASPETQMRAASVMRQALNEYNGLKKQQEENALKIYEAQSWIDYYSRNPHANPTSQDTSYYNNSVEKIQSGPSDAFPVVSNSISGTLNNSAPNVNTTVNAIDTNATMNVTTPVSTNNQITTSPLDKSATTYQVPKLSNVTFNQNTNKNNSIAWANYGPGSIATMPGTGNIVGLNTSYLAGRKLNNNNSLVNKLGRLIQRGVTYFYNNYSK